ncbi:MAG TPA: hypothetical protein VGO61_13615 [Steroidobacteraceae bacterium]|jgi:hypothetical protein|nr:hypothetical protein [Steroidobacteraceae bacterium]
MRFVKRRRNRPAQTRCEFRGAAIETRDRYANADGFSGTAPGGGERGTAGKRPDRGTFDLEPIDRVWSGHAVRFALEVAANVIFISYYDAQRQFTVA